MGILEIKHILANNNGLAMSCRLQYIVTSVRNQAATYKYHITDAVHLPQLTDGIEDYHIMASCRLFLELCPSGTSKASLLAHHLDGSGTQHRPGSNQQLGLWMGLADFGKGCQNLLLLTFVSGTCQKNPLIILQSQLIYKLLLFLLAYIGVGLVKFGIASNCHQLLAGPQAKDVFRIH